MPEICKEAQWLASLLMINDPAFTREIIDLVGQKNQIENLMKAWARDRERWVERLHTINEKIDLFIEAKLLSWQWVFYNLWDEAKSKIISHLKKAWYEIERTRWVLDAISTTELENWAELAVLLSDGNVEDASEMIKNFNEHLSRYIVAKDKMRLEEWIRHELSDELAKLKTDATNIAAEEWWMMSQRLDQTIEDEAGDIAWTTREPQIEQPSLFFKRDVPWTDEFETISQQEARNTVYQYFDSDEVSVIFADNLTTPEWQAALWAYLDKMIYFTKNPTKFTPEHEVVHWYIDLFLTKEEKEALRSDALNRYLDDIRTYMDLNWQQSLEEAAEDWIADWFIKYKQRKQTFTWALRDFFDELWYRIKKIFWSEDKIRSLYKDIEAKKRPANPLDNVSDGKMMFKRVREEQEKAITPYRIKTDPMLQYEYESRINTIRTLQTMIADDLERLKNANVWMFSVKDWLFWEALVKDMWDDIKEMSRMYAKKWEDPLKMSISELRSRIEDVRDKYKNAHKQKNVIADMIADRERDEKEMLALYRTPQWVKVEDVVNLEPIWVTSRNSLWAIIRDAYQDETLPEPRKWSRIDPMNKVTLPEDAEKVLRDEIIKDIDQVKKWEAPSNVASADSIWRQFSEMSDDVRERELLLNDYLIGKIYLWESDDVLESALKWLNWRNLEDTLPLTLTQIAKISDLWQLEQTVFSHIGDIIYDKSLRQALKDKQYELWTTATQWTAREQWEALAKARSIQKTSEFLQAWWLYSDVTLYDRVWNALRGIFDIDASINNRDLYDQFQTAITNFSSRRQSTTTKVWWVDMDATDLVRWIYAISRDDLTRDMAQLKADPISQLKVAAKKLFNIWDEKDAQQAQKRINDLFNSISPQDLDNATITQMAYTTTSAVKIEWEMTDSNVVFYNYRDWLYAQDPQTTYWEFFDELAKQNSLVVDTEHNIPEAFKITEIPSDTKYIIVNDINRWDDKELKDFIYSIPQESRPQVIYPRWGMMGNYYVENWKLKFKTTSNQLYNEITRNASARTLWAFAENIEEITEDSVRELEEKALEYFRTMMGLDMSWAPKNKAEYKERVINNLRIVTWLPISAEMDVYNPQSTWKMANDIIRYQLWATWRYTKVIKDVEQTITDIAEKFTNDRAWLFDDIKAIVWWNDSIMEQNAEEIRDAYMDYMVAPTIWTKVQSKWILMALANWWEYSEITIDLFNNAIRNDDIIGTLWPIIYWPREYTKAEQQALQSLWNDILSTYVFDFWSNLIAQWYSMPLLSPASSIKHFLKWQPIISDDFVQAFIKRNWLPENSSIIEGLFNDALPTELEFQMPASMILSISIEFPNIVVDEIPNVIIPTNYNQLTSIISKSSKWWWITWDEEEIIKEVLDNYYKVVERNIDAWTMTPTLAQQLKLQAWWALDIAEQDLLISKYDSFLTLEQRNWLMWGKYKLRIATTKDELESLKRWNQDVLNWYRQKLWEMWKDWIKQYNNLGKAKWDLIDKWKVMTVVNGKVIVVNVHDMLINQINTLPDWLKWIYENFRGLTKNDIRGIPYRQAYSMVKAIDLAKNAAARWNLYNRLMYKQNPQLANIDFFRRYALNSDWIPQAMSNNAAKLVDASISDWLDQTFKQDIMLEISNIMKKRWKISDEELKDIVAKELSTYWDNELIKNHYVNMFRAYTYLTDIPKDIKNVINWMLDTQLKEIREELSSLDWDLYDWLLNTRITLADWNELTLRDVLAWDIDSYKSNLFIERWSDWVYRNVNMKETTSAELWLTENQKIEFSDSMYSMINWLDQVTDAERQMNTVILNDARKILSKYTTTKRIIDADYLIWGQNDLLRNLIKSNAFSWWGKLWWDSDLVSKARDLATGKSLFNQEDWNTIRDYYYTYYWQSLDVLEKMKISNDLQATALEMAKYFKRIESTLGSADGSIWASVNTELNRALWRIWTIILNVNTSSQVHSLLNLIWNNQILGFFKFAKKWDWAYFDLFSSLKTNTQRFTWVQYIRDLELWDLKRFNDVFNSDFSMWEFKIIMQALGWYQLWSPIRSWMQTIMKWINSSSVLARAIMSYPFQLFTIAPQSIAYNFKANAYKRALWIEDMDLVNRIREANDILTSEYIELNPTYSIRNRLAKYWWDEVDSLIKNENVEMDDSIMELFWKSYDHASKNYRREQFVALFDATRDNANNIIDALMAQRFKNLAFVKALQNNNVMTFNNVESFQRFMNNIEIPQSLKDQVMDSIRIYSWRIFKDMLWTWFSWLDKVYASSVPWEILVGLMNTINFRWARWLNMFRQTFEKIFSAAKTLRFIWDERAMQQAVDYIARTPEFSNLSQAMFNDLVWMWKLARFSDNGKQPDDESEADIMDFCEWTLNNIELVSQQWQWLMSFWPTRLVEAPARAYINHLENPEEYWSNARIWAFINTLASNFWRNRKPWNFVISALRAWQADWDMSRAWDYIADNFYTLSAWTLRYMLEEWYNAYWANTPLVYEIGWIPAFVAWEQWEGSDTAFLYQMRQEETANYITHLIEWDEWYSVGNLFWQLMSYSQLFSFLKESVKLAWTALGKEDWKSSKSSYDLSDLDEAYADVPEWQEWRQYWFIMPKHEQWYTSYYDSIIYSLTESKAPGGSNFYKWIAKWLETWHINWKEEWSYYDAALEEFYARIEERDPGALKRLVNDESLMAEVAVDTKKAIQTSLSFMEKELALFDWDAEYNKYASLLYKWVMSNVMYDELNEFAEEKQADYRARWLIWPKETITASKVKKVEPLYTEFKQRFVDRHWDELRIADVESIENAMFNFLAKKSKEASDKFFTKKTYTDSEWNEYERYYFKSNIKSQVKQLIDFENAMANGERERAVVEWTALTKTFSYDHTVSPEVALHIFNRIKNSNTLSEKMKLEAMTEFVSNNLDAFTYDSEFAEENPELWNEVKWHYNEIIHTVNKELIQKANDYALSLESDKEKSWSSLAKKVWNISNKLAKIQESTSWWSSSRRSGGSHSITWLKAPILDPSKIINSYSKVPQVNFDVKFSTRWYTPKTNLWGSKTTAKPVKVKKTKVKEKDIEVI